MLENVDEKKKGDVFLCLSIGWGLLQSAVAFK